MSSGSTSPRDYPGAGQFLPNRRSLAALGRAVQGCEGCDLYQDSTQAVFGAGAPDARLVLVGEQPGDVEDREGKPFVGPAGRLLVRALEAAGVPTELTYRTNAVKHFRFKTVGKRRIHQGPAGWQVAACQPWLLAELEVLHPDGVVVLGATAGRSVLGADFRVGDQRGRLLDFPGAQANWLVATVHPSAVLRAKDREEAFDAMVSDLAVAGSALSRPG